MGNIKDTISQFIEGFKSHLRNTGDGTICKEQENKIQEFEKNILDSPTLIRKQHVSACIDDIPDIYGPPLPDSEEVQELVSESPEKYKNRERPGNQRKREKTEMQNRTCAHEPPPCVYGPPPSWKDTL